MSSSNLPVYVSKAAKTLKGAQFGFIVNATVWAYAQQVAGAPGSGAVMARAIVAEHPELSEKTLSNYCSTAVLLARQHVQIIAPIWSGAAVPFDVVAQLGAWLKAETKANGYTTSEPDLRNHADGKPSAAAKAQKDRDAAAAVAAVAAAAASAPKLGDAEDKAPVETPQAPVTPKDEPTPAGEREALAPADKPKEAPKAAPKAPDFEPVLVLSVRRDAAGRFILSPDASLTAADLPLIMAMMEKLVLPAPAPVIDTPRIPADVRTMAPALV